MFGNTSFVTNRGLKGQSDECDLQDFKNGMEDFDKRTMEVKEESQNAGKGMTLYVCMKYGEIKTPPYFCADLTPGRADVQYHHQNQ